MLTLDLTKAVCIICMGFFYIKNHILCTGQIVISCFYCSNKYMKEDHIILKEKETIPNFFNHTSVIGDEVKISYTVRLNTSTWSLNHFLQALERLSCGQEKKKQMRNCEGELCLCHSS